MCRRRGFIPGLYCLYSVRPKTAFKRGFPAFVKISNIGKTNHIDLLELSVKTSRKANCDKNSVCETANEMGVTCVTSTLDSLDHGRSVDDFD
ncbi:predicted protein [Plenodomus lingam JN3]|uniref:Predicted protein n=1 Tax=Leptosphaeria maculans (strain JN3 / isolate v23.1.3 / race Av1-4-5-6-7-8) TaxID=985895 RepID=E5A9M9_LEPMJ|nr:predicted protein [Plenodomus lingam JN3]CBY00370.1 predicted protein [Plenodomus lingam JN3]